LHYSTSFTTFIAVQHFQKTKVTVSYDYWFPAIISDLGRQDRLASFADILITRNTVALKDSTLCYKYILNTFKERNNSITVRIAGRSPDTRDKI